MEILIVVFVILVIFYCFYIFLIEKYKRDTKKFYEEQEEKEKVTPEKVVSTFSGSIKEKYEAKYIYNDLVYREGKNGYAEYFNGLWRESALVTNHVLTTTGKLIEPLENPNSDK